MIGIHHLTFLVILLPALSGCLGDTNNTLDDIEKNTSRMAEEMKYVKEIEKIGVSIAATQSEIAEMNKSFTGFWSYVQSEMAKVSNVQNTSTASESNSNSGNPPKTVKNNTDLRVRISGEDCIQAPAHQVAEVVTDYEAYPDNERAAVLKIESFPMLKLEKVELLHSIPEQVVSPTDLKLSVIRVTLHPTHKWLEKKELFPRFVLQCMTSGSKDIQFLQICSLVRNESEFLPFVKSTLPEDFSEHKDEIFNRYGIEGFYAVIKVNEAAEICKDSEHGANLFSYDIRIQPNDEHIESIKKESVERLKEKFPLLGYLASIVSDLFGDTFFEVYYKNYYRVWIEDFRP